MDSSFCERCGEPRDDLGGEPRNVSGGEVVGAAAHPDCEAALELEPPRYCRHCARRMVVQVTPAGWSARCVEHGTHSHAAA